MTAKEFKESMLPFIAGIISAAIVGLCLPSMIEPSMGNYIFKCVAATAIMSILLMAPMSLIVYFIKGQNETMSTGMMVINGYSVLALRRMIAVIRFELAVREDNPGSYVPTDQGEWCAKHLAAWMGYDHPDKCFLIAGSVESIEKLILLEAEGYIASFLDGAAEKNLAYREYGESLKENNASS